jgi:thymidylate synthase ThyX
MNETYAKVIADSIYEGGPRLTTMEVRFNRFVLAEFNTHRAFSRNSASSRAIPVSKQIERIRRNLAYPYKFPKEQKGMQGGEDIGITAGMTAKSIWRLASDEAVLFAQSLTNMGVHKSVVNRLLEPFMWHTVVVTSTAWENFFEQRCSPLAQPEIKLAAELMRNAYNLSTPKSLEKNVWHLPYIHEEDLWVDQETLARVSAARCARTSYLTQDGRRDVNEDLDLWNRLLDADPTHWSPLEHVATPWPANMQKGYIWCDGERYQLKGRPHVGNLLGWRSLRTTIEHERGEMTYR